MLQTQNNRVSSFKSVFLDSLRLLAALTVLVSHAKDQWFPNKHHVATESFDSAHSAVVIFFVLSGYVIAHTTTSNNRGAWQYAQARLSRLCSVLIPALIITGCAEVIVRMYSPVLANEYSRGTSLPRYLLSGFFLNEIWFASSAPPINGPLWSLSFEFWYYVIFGLWFFKKKGRKSVLLPIIACFIAGPKILLMMPIWLLGYFAYKVEKLRIISGLNLVLLLLVTFGAIYTVIYLDPHPYPAGTQPLFFAGQFLTDWCVGLLFAIILWLFPGKESVKVSKKTVYIIRKAADLTFPIYVLHHPLLIVWRALFYNSASTALNMWSAIVAIISICAVIGYVLDYYRGFWNDFFKGLLADVKNLLPKLKINFGYLRVYKN